MTGAELASIDGDRDMDMHGQPYTAADDAAIMERDGTWGEVAARLGRSETAVCVRAAVLRHRRSRGVAIRDRILSRFAPPTWFDETPADLMALAIARPGMSSGAIRNGRHQFRPLS